MRLRKIKSLSELFPKLAQFQSTSFISSDYISDFGDFSGAKVGRGGF